MTIFCVYERYNNKYVAKINQIKTDFGKKNLGSFSGILHILGISLPAEFGTAK